MPEGAQAGVEEIGQVRAAASADQDAGELGVALEGPELGRDVEGERDGDAVALGPGACEGHRRSAGEGAGAGLEPCWVEHVVLLDDDERIGGEGVGGVDGAALGGVDVPGAAEPPQARLAVFAGGDEAVDAGGCAGLAAERVERRARGLAVLAQDDHERFAGVGGFGGASGAAAEGRS